MMDFNRRLKPILSSSVSSLVEKLFKEASWRWFNVSKKFVTFVVERTLERKKHSR